MKTLNWKLSKPELLREINNLRNNLNNLFILGIYSDQEYKTYLDDLDNTELYLIMKVN